MKIAILGATSEISKDLIESFSQKTDYECILFSRNPGLVKSWLQKVNIQQVYQTLSYADFDVENNYDVIINFVGVGNPAQAKKMGSQIFDITYQYDMMVLNYLQENPSTKYIFLSSGAVYGGDFEQPVTNESVAIIPINNLKSIDWYTIAKLYAEARHRALSDLSIVDIRVFNYFSHTQDMNARYLITGIVRAIKNKEIFKTSSDNIVRDFITPPDFFKLVYAIVSGGKSINIAFDCYTKSPIDKLSILSSLGDVFGLKVEISDLSHAVNATGLKLNYFSLDKHAETLGYEPGRTSLEGIIEQVNIFTTDSESLITQGIKRK